MTSGDERDASKELQEQPAPHGHPALETIPNEIISSIAGMLAISIDLPYEVSRPDLTTFKSHKQECADACRDLRSLCMVSKRMVPNAQKALYRNVLITNANTLILLYRTFLENPGLGIYVKRMSLNIYHGRFEQTFPHPELDAPPYTSEDYPIDLNPFLSCAQHGLGEHFTELVEESWQGIYMIPAEIFFTMQFRVLGHTSNLESLDVNIQPWLPFIRTYNQMEMNEESWEEVGAVISSLWEEVLPCLSGVKKLQLIGDYEPIEIGGESIAMAGQLFSTRLCRLFLKLPNLEQLVWINYTWQWFSTLPFLIESGKL